MYKKLCSIITTPTVPKKNKKKHNAYSIPNLNYVALFPFDPTFRIHALPNNSSLGLYSLVIYAFMHVIYHLLPSYCLVE